MLPRRPYKGNEDVPGIVFPSRFIISRQNQPQAAQLFRRWYVERAQERIARRVQYFAETMGVNYHRVLISDLRVRWSSCTPRSNLNFNWRIMKAPAAVIDYLVVHELAHLLETNHTPHFWNVVSVQVPQVEWAKQWLRSNGGVLEIDF